jgi:hypothetical protein
MEEEMLNKDDVLRKTAACCLVVLLLAMTMGCSKSTQPPAVPRITANRIPAGQEFSGFLKDYSALQPNPNVESALTYVSSDAQKNLRSYFAIVVDPVTLYVATDVDEGKVSEASVKAVTNYFEHALKQAVSDAFPIVEAPGPLTLRLRAALVGVDVGGAVPAGDMPADVGPLDHVLNIAKLRVEAELLDSETGERIAAIVDNANLGAGADVGAQYFSRVERFAAARDAFDQWAGRLREFLDSAHTLSGQDAERADKAYKPYSARPASK